MEVPIAVCDPHLEFFDAKFPIKNNNKKKLEFVNSKVCLSKLIIIKKQYLLNRLESKLRIFG